MQMRAFSTFDMSTYSASGKYTSLFFFPSNKILKRKFMAFLGISCTYNNYITPAQSLSDGAYVNKDILAGNLKPACETVMV